IGSVNVDAIDLKDLDAHGETEVVRVVVKVTGVDVDDIRDTVQRMMSKFGDVYTLPKYNQLVLTDTVATVRMVDKMLRQDEAGGNAETFSHVCDYIKARDAERVLKELLGDPAKLLAAQAQAPPPGTPPGFRPPQAPSPALP